MSGFSADWLHLREPFDHLAREASCNAFALSAEAARWRTTAKGATLSVTDLACGSGSTVRALAPRLGGAQQWRLVDNDPALLAAVPEAMAVWARQRGYQHQHHVGQAGHVSHAHVHASPGALAQPEPDCIEIAAPNFTASITLVHMDLACELSRLDLAGTHLVTGSALLDLVSAQWLEALVLHVREARAAMLFALNVDGRTAWAPPDPQDDDVHALFTSHQGRDKGFGPALGGQAVALATRLMYEAGYEVAQAQSDWVIDAASADADTACDAPSMLTAMIDGMAEAASQQADASAPFVSTWRSRRLAARPSTRLQVGHVDLFATLP